MAPPPPVFEATAIIEPIPRYMTEEAARAAILQQSSEEGEEEMVVDEQAGQDDDQAGQIDPDELLQVNTGIKPIVIKPIKPEPEI